MFTAFPYLHSVAVLSAVGDLVLVSLIVKGDGHERFVVAVHTEHYRTNYPCHFWELSSLQSSIWHLWHVPFM